MQGIKSKQPNFYEQVPDSEPTGVLSAVNDASETFNFSRACWSGTSLPLSMNCTYSRRLTWFIFAIHQDFGR